MDVEIPPNADDRSHGPGPLGFVEDPRRPVVAWTGTLKGGFGTRSHSHPRAQLALCYHGLMQLRVDEDAWFIPARFGVWIPAGRVHRLTAQTDVDLHSLFIDPLAARRDGLPDAPTVVRASPLLRGIAQRLAPAAVGGLAAAEMRRLAWVTLEEIARLDRPDMRLPGGRDARVAAAMAHMVGDPADRHGLSGAACAAGCSERTLARLFPADTGMTFRDWRNRMRFMLALEGLERGETSTALAARLGWSTTSAFTAAFRRHFGAPPTAYRGNHPGREAPPGHQDRNAVEMPRSHGR
ncbi:AraC family transcriptional regulator [Chachezhania sediminis]|uniref:AraC family transcriptional regulator n=1 Tax=Chachezhania sediminis TaxID=2599291 RepID=UPI001E316B07|nr:helix-turn-helix transcriptional regulator [Chachezhania sediminis]